MMFSRRGLAVTMLACYLAVLPAAGASGEQGLFAAYAPLVEDELAPAPLVPIVLPAVLGGAAAVPTVLIGSAGTYSLSFDGRVARHGVVAGILLQELGNRSLGGRREFFGALYRYTKTRVRGHRALLLRARLSPVRSLVWREQGELFELSTNTPHKISVATLRAVAARLEHLRGGLTAQAAGAEGATVAVQALVADHAYSLAASWTAPCRRASGEAAPARSSQLGPGWVRAASPGPLQAGGMNPGTTSEPPWGYHLSGSLSAGGQLTFSASLVGSSESCAVGPQALTLARLPVHSATS